MQHFDHDFKQQAKVTFTLALFFFFFLGKSKAFFNYLWKLKKLSYGIEIYDIYWKKLKTPLNFKFMCVQQRWNRSPVTGQVGSKFSTGKWPAGQIPAWSEVEFCPSEHINFNT